MYNEILSFTQTQHVLLLAVSKTKPVSEILKLYDKGQRDFGENKVQELIEKQALLPSDINWHLIGHLQKNKVKYIAPFVHMIHAVESIGLLVTINEHAIKNNRKIPVLLQFHIAKEDTKFGMTYDEAVALINYMSSNTLENVIISGVMGMATFSDDVNVVREEFKLLKKYYDQLKETYFKSNFNFKHISMGMSGDYKIAIEEGSTIVRIGSAIFGNR